MKKIVALLLCLTCAFSLAACSSGDKKDDKDNLDKQVDEAVDALKDFIKEQTDIAEQNKENEVEKPVDPKTVDFSKIDTELKYEDGANMPQFMNDMQAGKYDNKVIKVTGLMSTSMMDKTTNNVMQYVSEGAKQGFSWRIIDANESTEYPADGTKIELVGVMIAEYNEAWGMYGHYLYVLPENVKDLGYPEN